MPPLREAGKMRAFEAIHSAGNKTVGIAIDIGGMSFPTIIPEGTSAGEREKKNLTVSQAIENIQGKIIPALTASNIDIVDQRAVDDFLVHLDGTPDRSNLGVNAILPVSEVCARAAAYYLGIPLFVHLARIFNRSNSMPNIYEIPVPHANVLNGGRHGKGGLPIQEVMIVPKGANSYNEAADMLIAIYGALGTRLGIPASGTEAGYIPTNFKTTNGPDRIKESLEMLDEVVRHDARLQPGKDIFFALDIAASELFRDNLYWIDERKGWNANDVTKFLLSLMDYSPIISIEDGLGQNEALENWAALTAALKRQGAQSVGDDLLVTNMLEIDRAIPVEAVDSILIKLNQIGTITETMDAVEKARNAGWTTMISHRSKMADNFESDLAVALRARQAKLGPLAKERIMFHNRLLDIESYLGKKAVFAGLNYSSTS